MYKIESTRQFRSDFKTLRQSDSKKVLDAIEILEYDGSLPQEPYHPHKLKGNYEGNWEAHVRPDLLIIWYTIENDTIKLLRVGSHAKLFGK